MPRQSLLTRRTTLSRLAGAGAAAFFVPTLNNYVRAVRYPDGVIINGTGAAESGYTTSAAIGPGDILALYGTGFGPTSSPLNAGVVFNGAYETSNVVTVAIGGISPSALRRTRRGWPLSNKCPDSCLTQRWRSPRAGTQATALIKVAANAKLAPTSL